MYRLLILAIVLFAVTPTASLSQSATPVVRNSMSDIAPAAEDLGVGWELVESLDTTYDSESGLIDRLYNVYAGPAGSHLLVDLYDVPARLSERAPVWDELSDYWQNWANFYAAPHTDAEDRVDVNGEPRNQAELPSSINDSLRSVGVSGNWDQQSAVGLYALEGGPVVFIVLEGQINEKALFKAIDFVAALIADRFNSR